MRHLTISLTVFAALTLLAPVAPIPEPSAVLLFGIGLAVASAVPCANEGDII